MNRSPVVYCPGMVYDIGSCLLKRAEGLSGELQLALEIGMLVHEGEQVVIYDRELLPDGWTGIPVIIHVAVQDVCHIHRTLPGLCGKRQQYEE